MFRGIALRFGTCIGWLFFILSALFVARGVVVGAWTTLWWLLGSVVAFLVGGIFTALCYEGGLMLVGRLRERENSDAEEG